MTRQGQGDHQRVLRQRAEVLVLERLLGGRAPGAEGSPDVSRPTSTASSPDRRASTGRADRRRRSASRRLLEKEDARLTPAQAAAAAQRRRQGVRRARRREGRTDRRIRRRCKFDPAVLQCKSGQARRLSDCSAGRDGAGDLLADQDRRQARDSPASRPAASWAGPISGWSAVRARDRPRSLPLPRLQGSGVGLARSSTSRPTSRAAGRGRERGRSTRAIRI